MEHSYQLGLYEKSMPNTLRLEEKLLLVQECGYDFLEISVDESEEKMGRLWWNKERRSCLVQASRENGVPVATMCLSAHRKYPLGSEAPVAAAKSLEIMKRAVDFSAEIGIRLIQIAGYDEYYKEQNERTRENFLKNLQLCVEMAAASKVMLGFETMETAFMNTCGKAMEYVCRVDSPYLTIYPDIGNMTNAAVASQTDVLRDLEMGAGHLSAMHLKETAPNIFREVPYGTGHVEFEKAIEKAWQLGVRSFTAEFWYVGNEDWKNILCKNNHFLREKFPDQVR